MCPESAGLNLDRLTLWSLRHYDVLSNVRSVAYQSNREPVTPNAVTDTKMADYETESNSLSAERSAGKLDKLLTVAADLMAVQGYDQTSVRDVARETGFSLAGMYYYFQSKEDLLFQIQHRTFASLLDEQESIVNGKGSAEERLGHFIQNHLSFYTRHFNEMKVCTFELHSLKDERYTTIESLRRKNFKIAMEIVREIVGDSGPPDDGGEAVRHYTLFIFGMLNWIFMWFDPDRDAPLEKLSDELVHLALHGLHGSGS